MDEISYRPAFGRTWHLADFDLTWEDNFGNLRNSEINLKDNLF